MKEERRKTGGRGDKVWTKQTSRDEMMIDGDVRWMCTYMFGVCVCIAPSHSLSVGTYTLLLLFESY
jgi:hypothetical protein